MRMPLAICFSLGMAWSAAAQSTPRDTPPPVIENARQERELRALIASGGATRDTYTELAALLNRQGKGFEAVEALRGAAAQEPASAEAQHRVAVFLWDAVQHSPTLDADARRGYILQAVASEDRALALQPEYAEALTYKNVLLRMQANLSPDPLEQKRLIEEADTLRNRVIEMQRQRQVTGFSEPFEATLARVQPVRVGGDISTPVKVHDVRPVFPPIAQSARVQGVVIIEALIDGQGKIANARVLRSIPLLDQAALDAVRQWQFTPTLVDGQPAGVIMTVTVNFTLQ